VTSPSRGHWAGVEYHGRLLADLHRMDAYERAIRALVRPGDVVLDLGAGTGVLAMLAARRGAARVHAVESTPVAALARELVRDNGLEAQVRVHEADVVTLAPLEPVDLIVSDFLGRFLVDDEMLDAVAASRAWLRPGGRFCPGAVELILAPAGNFLLDTVDAFRFPIYGLDFSAGLARALRRPYGGDLLPASLLAAPQRFARYEPAREASPALSARLDFALSGTGELRALAGWFRAELAPGVTLCTEPGIQSHWGQMLFPLPPAAVQPGDRLSVSMAFEPLEAAEASEPLWRWSGRLERAGATVVAFDLADDTRFVSAGTAERGPP
jgi:SAM-dependent methyltransferase